MGKVTIPHPLRGSPLYTRGPFLYDRKLPSTQCGPMTSIGPYRARVETFGPRGVNVGRVQSAVKKMQSFLHF